MSHLETSPIIRHQGADRAVTVIPVRGELNSDTAAKFERALETIADEHDREVDVILDLSGVSEITSVCLGLLVNYMEEWTSADRRFLVASPSPVVAEVFSLLGLAAMFPKRDVESSLVECGVADRRGGRPTR